MTMITEIPLATARKLVLRTQLLDGHIELPAGKAGIHETISRLGYVQIDTIAVINRAHHHVLWSRNRGYDEMQLHDLQARERSVFEYWGHAMSYLPIADFRYYLSRMESFKNPAGAWAKHQYQKCAHLLAPVLKRIREEGPLTASDFAAPADRKAGTWWDWKPAKVALELLFWQGELMISERRNFQKVYDLTERVLPPDLDISRPGKEELARFLVQRAVSAMGLVTENDIMRFLQSGQSRDSDMQAVPRQDLKEAIVSLAEASELRRLRIQDHHADVYFANSRTLDNFDPPETADSTVKLLSPFDNLVIHRARLKRLFGFDYSLECYLPEAKRKYGYFVLPILWKDNFVGRLDPKADRQGESLLIRNLHFEPQFVPGREFTSGLAKALAEFSIFNGCSQIKIEAQVIAKLKRSLTSDIKKYLA